MKYLEASSWRLMKFSMKKLEILKKDIKFRGGLLGLKYFLMILELPLLRYSMLILFVMSSTEVRSLVIVPSLKL
ncbi:hypothetical protein Tco_0477811 [Tanacetum coccineum]